MRKLLLFAMLALQPFAVLAQSATPISGLPAATTPLAGTEIVPVVQSGVTRRTTTAAIASSVLPLPNTWSSTNVVALPGASSTDTSVTTGTSTVQAWRQASSSSTGQANEQTAFFSINIPSGHGSGIAYEVEPVYGRCITADSNTFALGAYDCVGGEFQAITSGTGQLMRVWGVDSTVNVVAGSDGYATGYETDIYNNATTGGLQTPTVKHNFFANCNGPNNCTSIFDANAIGGSAYNYGFPMIKGIFTSGACVFCVVDGSASFASIAGVYADGHSVALNNSYVIGTAATTRYSGYYTGANSSSLSLRWNAGANNTAESGSNAGSDYNICSYSDAGSFITCGLVISRSTGTVTANSMAATTFYNSVANITTPVAAGSAPTLTGTCSTGTKVGGNSAGSFKFSAICTAGTVILTFTTAAPNGWACRVNDMTTPADALNQTGYTTSTATITGTAASGDQTTFLCEAF